MNKERYQVMQLATKEHLVPEMKDYLSTFEELEDKREGLDFEIGDILAELDTEKHYSRLKNGNLSDIKPGSKLGRLIDKMMERTIEINK